MSDRGLLLALQRLHDDPGFVDMVAQDPDQTLGLYDMSDEERQALAQAVVNGDGKTIDQMAERLGMDWTADHIPGAGAIDGDDVGANSQTSPRLGLHIGDPTGASNETDLAQHRPLS